MQVEWYGQSAFALRTPDASVFIDPFGDVAALSARGIAFEYPPIEAGEIDLLLVTHEHLDHNAVEVIAGEPATLRATAGRHSSPLGEVVGVASEHDSAAGTERGPNTIFAFELDGVRVAHFGDFGQSALRPEQAAALGEVDLAFLPVGGGPTIGAEGAAAIVAELKPRWVVPMHYRTPRVDFLETEEEFLGLSDRIERIEEPRFETAELPVGGGPVAVVPAAP
ncbi:MAG TPA: MBL fold metallo-hydrolase [Solirubrobacterales bacterium]|nr:MBL fold metallo-hydrolase [Solirubrobacterales bacterium]